MKVSVHQLTVPFRGGISPGEDRLLQKLEINISIGFPGNFFYSHQDLEHTVDYTHVVQIIKAEAQQPTLLLESLALRIGQRIEHAYPFIDYADIHIRKKPVLNVQLNAVSVQYRHTPGME